MTDNNQAWTEKYRPESTSDVQGNTKNVKALKKWVTNFTKGDKPKLLVGPPGVGKSSSIQAIANDLGIPLLEINASDARRTDEVNAFVKDAYTSPIMAENQLVMFDEADSMSGRTNFNLLYKLMEDAPNPVVFIANDSYQVPRGIKNRSETMKFRLGTRSIKAKLKKIIKAEDMDVGASTLTRLSQRESLRDAINDLQQMSGKQELRADERQYESSIFDEVDNAIKGKETDFSETPDDVLLWIDQNIRGRWRLVEAMAGWDCLSRSDKWLGRVNGSDYSWWKYAGSLQDQFPKLRLTEAYDGYIDKQRPEKMKRGWGRGTEGDVYDKLTGRADNLFKMGCSFYEFKTRYLPILKDLPKERVFNIALEAGLEGSEIELLGQDASEFEEWKEGGDVEYAEQREEESGSVGGFMEF